MWQANFLFVFFLLFAGMGLPRLSAKHMFGFLNTCTKKCQRLFDEILTVERPAKPQEVELADGEFIIMLERKINRERTLGRMFE